LIRNTLVTLNPERVVSLNRNQVVSLSGISTLIAQRFNIDGCPTLVIVDKNGKLTRRPIDPRADKGDDLVSIINQQDKLE